MVHNLAANVTVLDKVQRITV